MVSMAVILLWWQSPVAARDCMAYKASSICHLALYRRSLLIDQSLLVFVSDLSSSSLEELNSTLELNICSMLPLVILWCFSHCSSIHTCLGIFPFTLELSIIWSLLTELNCHIWPFVLICTYAHQILFV